MVVDECVPLSWHFTQTLNELSPLDHKKTPAGQAQLSLEKENTKKAN